MNNKKWIVIFTALVMALVAEVTFTIINEHRVVVARYERRVSLADELANLDQGCAADSADAEKIIDSDIADSITLASASDIGTRAVACRETINRVVDLIDSLDNRK